MDDAEAKSSAPYVFAERGSDAELSFRVTATEIASGASIETFIYFRGRRTGEAVVRVKPLDFPKRGQIWRSWPKESFATIYRDRLEAWLRFSKHSSAGFSVRYGEDARIEQDGFLIIGAWLQKPNKSPEPTPTAGTVAAEPLGVPAAGVAHL